jgi:phosphoribosylglycinamide formyltransferase-1
LKNIAIFASGGGSNAQSIVSHFAEVDWAQVVLIVTNNARAGVIQRAARLGVPCLVLTPKQYKDPAYLQRLMRQFDISLVALAGYLKLIPPAFTRAFPGKILNIHPALLPAYGGKGMYGMNVHRAVIEAGEAESGMSIHLVNEQYDEGEVLFQDRVSIAPDWSPEDLQQAVLRLEHRHFPRVIEEVLKEGTNEE